ncbi:MAG: hypothetical protein OXC30_04605, partial [Alphaproteobacteria bacterium]|nr:hypothetical protein [Alphaproteobacteria bacterium]
SIESDESHGAVSVESCERKPAWLFPVLADTVMQDNCAPVPVTSPSVDVDEGGVSIPPKKKGMCERLYEQQKARTPVKIEQQEDMYPQEEEVPALDYHFVPEPEVVESIKAFLSKNKYSTLDVDDMGNYRLRMWLKKWNREIYTYPFLVDRLGEKSVFELDKYADDIKKVMQRLCGIFCWELKQSRDDRDALPGWKPKEGEGERYPKIKKILIHWKQGPFPQSFCANIMFLMQNKKRLEKLGCKMDFLDECCNYLPASLNPFMSGSCQYKEFYKDVFCHTDIYRKALERFVWGMQNDRLCSGKKYQNYYWSAKFLMEHMEHMENFSIRKENVQAAWLCDLANKLMIADIILGGRPKINFSIQGLAAYINANLECVQVHPDGDGMNTATLDYLVHVITGGKSDIGVCDCDKRAFYVDSWNQMVFPLHKKSHGLKWGIPQFVKEKGWVKRPEYYTQEDEAFHKTKAAMACLTRFGISIDVVQTLQACMDAKGEIPSSLYHDPLTDSALNNLLASCEKERVVKSHALNAMKSNVDRIVYQSKIVWPEG